MQTHSLVERNIKIKRQVEKKPKHVNMSEIASDNEISRTRLYQIIGSDEKKCSKHGIIFYSSCAKCKRESIAKKKSERVAALLKGNTDLTDRIKKYSKHDRSEEAIKGRIALVKELIDKHKLKSTEVSVLIKRHHSTVSCIYKKK